MIPTITSPLVARVAAGQPFHYQIAATDSPTSFNATDMPAGLSIDHATGVISGAPLVEQPSVIWYFPISATNDEGTGRAFLELTISEAPTPAIRPVITSPLSATATGGSPFRYRITARNGPIVFFAEGLPAGLAIAAFTGIISGSPTEVGRFRVTIGATNAAGSGTASLILDIAVPISDDPRWCHLPHRKNLSGPDVPGIYCRPPDGCCGPDICNITELQFICAIRSLLPEGDIYNNTRIAVADPPENHGTITIGCARIGCEQLIFGGCCDDNVHCNDEPIAPQLAVVDAYASAAYGVIRAMCDMMKELDPCTANLTLARWAERFGINLRHPDPCGPGWSPRVAAILICALLQIRHHVVNWEYLTVLAQMFGSTIALRYAGDLNGGPDGWWTLARDQVDCGKVETCPADSFPYEQGLLKMTPQCESLPPSLNLIICPSDIIMPENCNLPPVAGGAHDPELYLAFKWLLPIILPQPIFWCIYECDPENCIV